jgi:hypothetical protein
MATESHKSLLSIKEVKIFNLFDYIYPDLDDKFYLIGMKIKRFGSTTKMKINGLLFRKSSLTH